MEKTKSGFTLVELLIVIVVIAVIAAISVIAYNGIQDRARASVTTAELSDARKKVLLYDVEKGQYPDSDPVDPAKPGLAGANFPGNGIVGFQYSVNNSVTPRTYCITASNGVASKNISQTGQMNDGVCPGHYRSLATGLNGWTVSGGVTKTGNEIILNSTTAGAATSAKQFVGGTTTFVQIDASVYATLPSPTGAPYSIAHFSTKYYGADGTTPVTNTTGNTGNGNAICKIALSTWRSCRWATATGPNVHYVAFIINSSPTQYTSDNIYRSIQLSANP